MTSPTRAFLRRLFEPGGVSALPLKRVTPPGPKTVTGRSWTQCSTAHSAHRTPHTAHRTPHTTYSSDRPWPFQSPEPTGLCRYGGQQANQVCLAENVVVVDCSGTLTIDFLSGIDQAEADESWAFSNLQVIGSNGETVLLDETRNTADDGAVATGWSNGEISDVGSAGNVHGAPFPRRCRMCRSR